jgi:hypothetical protein
MGSAASVSILGTRVLQTQDPRFLTTGGRSVALAVSGLGLAMVGGNGKSGALVA